MFRPRNSKRPRGPPYAMQVNFAFSTRVLETCLSGLAAPLLAKTRKSMPLQLLNDGVVGSYPFKTFGNASSSSLKARRAPGPALALLSIQNPDGPLQNSHVSRLDLCCHVCQLGNRLFSFCKKRCARRNHTCFWRDVATWVPHSCVARQALTSAPTARRGQATDLNFEISQSRGLDTRRPHQIRP